jgi:hypothetical protein
LTWSGGTITGTETTFNGALAISGTDVHDLTTRTLNLHGTTTWTNVNSVTWANPNRQRATINNAGLFQDQISTPTAIANDLGGPNATFNNTGTFTKRCGNHDLFHRLQQHQHWPGNRSGEWQCRQSGFNRWRHGK